MRENILNGCFVLNKALSHKDIVLSRYSPTPTKNVVSSNLYHVVQT